MSIQISLPSKDEFAKSVIQRQGSNATRTEEDVVTQLNMYYARLDERARRAFIDSAVRMYNNYENRWLGDVQNGEWLDSSPQGTNNTYFTVPLLTAHVDTHMTYYTKVRPKYVAKPFNKKVHLNRQLATMCEEIGTAELGRMLKPSVLQHEAQYIALATVSYRHLVMGYQKHSPTIDQVHEMPMDMVTNNYQCNDCGGQFSTDPVPNQEKMPGPEPAQCQDESCMSDNTTPTGSSVDTQMVQQTVKVTLPRAAIQVPNPITVQDDFSAATFEDSRFIVTRRKISVREAEFYYQIDLSSAFDNSGMEAESQERGERMPIGPAEQQRSWIPLAFPQYVDQQNLKVEEVSMWLEPCEYGLYVADGGLLQQKYPNGAFFHIVGNKLVENRACDKSIEWVRVQQGVRPSSNKGMGLVHLADINDAINNSVSLDYSILRTHGFPLRLLRGKWLSLLPQANQTIVLNKIADDQKLQDAVHTEQATNTSGLLGINTNRLQGFMQYIGGSLNPTGMPSDMKDIMGSATGAASVQEMMSDRMGLPIQMRVEADINTIYAVLELLKHDKRNHQYFLDNGYDATVVDAFFTSDFRSMFYFEPAKGTDEPRMDSVSTFKVQAFAQLTAALTGLRQYDPNTFYDITSALGDTLGIDVAIGAGRKERNLADNRITRIIELYTEQKGLQDTLQMDPTTFGTRLFQAVTMKEQQWLQVIIASQVSQMPPGATQEQKMLLMMEAQHIAETIEVGLYDYDALIETYSDWLQSDEGQNCDIPVGTAVGMLYAYCVNMQQKKKQIAQQEQMQMALAASGGLEPPPEEEGGEPGKPGAKEDNPPGPLKKDGAVGPGRPRNVKVDK